MEIVAKLIPKLISSCHKGSCGKIAIIGGSFEYTGAPYYAALSTLNAGGDLAFIICASEAAIPIKSYNPEVIVYPYLRSMNENQSNIEESTVSQCVRKISDLFNRFDAIVIGPGLGRDEQIMQTASELIKEACKQDIPLVIDGDALFLLSLNPTLIYGYKNVLLTPNNMEFTRLYNAVMKKQIKVNEIDDSGELDKSLAKELGNISIFHKGATDIITDGNTMLKNNKHGSTRRCGGQGDICAGTSGLFLNWSKKAQNQFDNTINMNLYGAYGASLLTRMAQEYTFKEKHRSMTTPDVIDNIGRAFETLFPVEQYL
ncbi:hypothetical protein WA158_007470 [Blastocystis sp. Blastoise]